MAIVRPSDITTERSSPVASEYVVVDNDTTVAKATIANVVAAGRPLANQAEAEAGANATNTMTPLTTKQHVDKRISDGDTVPDGSVTEPKLADGSVIARVITSVAAGIAAIGFKLGLVTNGDMTVYVDASTGDDSTGDGTIGAPYATPQKAWDSLPWIIKDKCLISIADGTYATSSRSAASMDRPALIYCDGKRVGIRTDIPGGDMTGVAFVGESKAGVILQPGSANGYTRGIYVTGHVGSVGFQNLTIDAQAGTEAGIVAHRGVYVHPSDIDLDGNSVSNSLGLVGEAGGKMEAVDVTVHDFSTNVQVYGGSSVQLAQASTIGASTALGATISRGGILSLAVGAVATTKILALPGSVLETAGTSGSPITLGDVEVRGADWGGEYTNCTGTLIQRAGSRIAIDVFAWSGNWNVYGGYIRTPAAKSYVSPATQSTVTTPLIFLGDGYHLDVDSSFEIINSSGTQVSEDIGHQTYTVTADSQTLPFSVRGRINTFQVNASTARADTRLPTTQTGRLAGTPFPNGVIFEVFGTGGAVTIVENSVADIPGNTAILGSAAGNEISITCIWSSTLGKWLVKKGGTR